MMDSSATTMDSSAVDPPTGGVRAAISSWISPFSQWYQHVLDKATPHVLRRWLGFVAIALVYAIRVWFVQGFYVVSYALGIYVLNIFIAFLSPQVDPEIIGALDGDGGAVLPTRSSDEFRPFVRRLPEFKFWYSITKAFCIAFIATFFSVFDVPVFWPILLFYWLMLFTVTMKRQIRHMIKYRYLPFSSGKQRYTRVSSEDATLPAE